MPVKKLNAPSIPRIIKPKSSVPFWVPSICYSAVLAGFVWYLLAKSSLLDHQALALAQSVPLVVLIQLLYCVTGGIDILSCHKKTVDPFKLRLSTAILSAIIALVMSFLVLGLLILFGAPFDSLLLETLLCSVHISVLSVQPLVYVYSLDADVWKQIVSTKLRLDGVYGASVGTWIGAWMGAIPIPLDWDRPWQQWPITILVGAYLGTILGALYGTAYNYIKGPIVDAKKKKL